MSGRRHKQARRVANKVTGIIPPPGKWDGVKWWQVLLSFVWPKVLDRPRKARRDLHDRAMTRAVKKTAHHLARDKTGVTRRG